MLRSFDKSVFPTFLCQQTLRFTVTGLELYWNCNIETSWRFSTKHIGSSSCYSLWSFLFASLYTTTIQRIILMFKGARFQLKPLPWFNCKMGTVECQIAHMRTNCLVWARLINVGLYTQPDKSFRENRSNSQNLLVCVAALYENKLGRWGKAMSSIVPNISS